MLQRFDRLVAGGAMVALIGFILSGPVAFLIVQGISPQPSWVSPEVFVRNYRVIQDLPYYFGFMLVGGMLMLSAGHYLNFREGAGSTKFKLLLALACTTVFGTLITFNYICQTTFIAHLCRFYTPLYDGAIASFSMTNPLSLCWALEMWGYAFLGMATWLMEGYYRTRSSFIRTLLVSNGIVSVASAVWTIIDIAWVMTSTGLFGYFVWNVLMIVLVSAIFQHARRSVRHHKIPSHENAVQH